MGWAVGSTNRQRNRRAVLKELMLHGTQSRTVIAARIGLTLATVSRIARGLIASGLIGKLPRENDAHDRPGRPPVSLDILPEGGQVPGAVINPGFQGVALSDLENRTIVEVELDLDRVDDPDLVIERVVDSSRHLMDRFVPDRHRLRGSVKDVPIIAGS